MKEITRIKKEKEQELSTLFQICSFSVILLLFSKHSVTYILVYACETFLTISQLWSNYESSVITYISVYLHRTFTIFCHKLRRNVSFNWNKIHDKQNCNIYFAIWIFLWVKRIIGVIFLSFYFYWWFFRFSVVFLNFVKLYSL